MNDYHSELSDLPLRALALGVRALLNDDREWYSFPSIGNIRGYANRFLKNGILSADEAWRACLEGRAPADSLAFQVFENLGFDRYDLALSSLTQVTVRQSNFIKTYQEAIARSRTQACLPPALRNALPRPQLARLDNGKAVPEQPTDVLSPENAKIRLKSLYSELAKQKKAQEESALTQEDLALVEKRKAFLKRQAEHIVSDRGEYHGA